MFKTYAIISGDTVVEYPVDPHTTHQLPDHWLGGELDGKQYVFCHNREPERTHEEDLVEITPAKNVEEQCWYRQYQVVRASDEEIAARTQERAGLCENSINRALSVADEVLAQNLSTEQVAAWEKYKLDVLAVREQPTFPWNLMWPVRPDVETVKIEVTRL